MMIFKTSSVGGVTFHTLLNDQVISKCLELYGEWSFGEIQLLARLLPRNANIIELGSNIGSHTVFLAKSMCPDGTVYAFEPRRIYFQTLCANLVANGISNVHAFQLGAGEQHDQFREGAIPTRSGINAGGLALGEIAGSDEEISLVALDDKIDSFRPVSLIKADIEGYELAALKGAQKLLNRDRPLLYLEANNTAETPDLLRHLMQAGYALWWHTPPWIRPNNRGGLPANIFPNWKSHNLLACPQEQQTTITLKVKDVPDLIPAEDAEWHPEKTA